MLGAHRLDWAEELAQEALLRALETWPYQGVPPNPEAWLLTTAKNRAIDRLRRERLPIEPLTLEDKPATDDQLSMIFLCCHPSLSEEMQVALTLQVVCGLNARQISRGLMLSESAVAQRLVRAKRQLRESGARFQSEGRLETVLAVLYLLFNEGYAASEQGAEWFRPRPM
jgi:RNA polymerase sigma-70 factor (ECF subfamily)